MTILWNLAAVPSTPYNAFNIWRPLKPLSSRQHCTCCVLLLSLLPAAAQVSASSMRAEEMHNMIWNMSSTLYNMYCMLLVLTSCRRTTRSQPAHSASTATSCWISRDVSAARRRLRMNLAAYSTPDTRCRILRTDANLPLWRDERSH